MFIKDIWIRLHVFQQLLQKETFFCDFLFAFLDSGTLQKEGELLKENILPEEVERGK